MGLGGTLGSRESPVVAGGSCRRTEQRDPADQVSVSVNASIISEFERPVGAAESRT